MKISDWTLVPPMSVEVSPQSGEQTATTILGNTLVREDPYFSTDRTIHWDPLSRNSTDKEIGNRLLAAIEGISLPGGAKAFTVQSVWVRLTSQQGNYSFSLKALEKLAVTGEADGSINVYRIKTILGLHRKA